MTLDVTAVPVGAEPQDLQAQHSPDAVRLLLEMSELAPSEAEVAALGEAFARARAGARSLYAVTEARYEQPAQTFRAVPGGERGPAQ